MEFSLQKISFYLFLVLVFSLAFMQPYILFGKLKLPYTDIIFLLSLPVWIISIFIKKTSFRWHPFYWLLVLYFGAMLTSTIFSNNPGASFIKLSGEIYLLSLPVLTFNLIRNFSEIKYLIFAWLAGTIFAIFFGVLAVFLFYLAPENTLLRDLLFYHGTLPAGNYPRIKSTFLNGNMFCNYLTASLMLTLVAGKLKWLGEPIFYLLFAGILITSLFTISPGLGGIGLCLGFWFWFVFKQKDKFIFARLSFYAGILISIIFLFLTAIAFQNHPTAPFAINLPVFDAALFPSARLMAWIESFQTFLANPFAGVGLGENVCSVNYADPTGNFQILNDAHNTFLNIAGQSGLFGLTAIIGITIYLTKKVFAFPNFGELKTLKFGFGLIFISCFVYQGLSGSFEDARHIWIIVGVILSLDFLTSADSP